MTGAGRRLGRAVSLGLAKAGHFIVLHCNASRPEAETLAEEIRADGGSCGVIQANLADRAQIGELLPRARALFGPVSGLVNNASSYHFDSVDMLDAPHWDENLRTNLEAPVFLASALAAGGANASIVNMLDFKVANLNPDHLSYTLAKVAMAGFTRMAAMAWHGRVRVNAIAPGLTLRSGRQSDEQFERAWRMVPLGHGPTPEEISSAVVYLMRTMCVNGQILCLDGGASLRPRARDISVDPAAL